MSAIAGFPAPVPMDTFHMQIGSSGNPQQQKDVLNNSQMMQQNSMKNRKFKLEPMKVLEPSNKKLTLPESQRIMYILDEFIRQLEVLDYMEVITNNDDKVSILIRSELNDDERKNNIEQIFISMCQNHRALVDAYKKGNFDVESNLALKNKETLQMLIKSSCKDILRVTLKKGNWFENFKRDNAKFKINHIQVNELKGKSSAHTNRCFLFKIGLSWNLKDLIKINFKNLE